MGAGGPAARADFADARLGGVGREHHGAVAVGDGDDLLRIVGAEEERPRQHAQVDGGGEQQAGVAAQRHGGDAAPAAGGQAAGGGADVEGGDAQLRGDVGHRAVVLRRVRDREGGGEAQGAGAVDDGDIDELRVQAQELPALLDRVRRRQVGEAHDRLELDEVGADAGEVGVQRLLGDHALDVESLGGGGAVVDELLANAQADQPEQRQDQRQREQRQAQPQRVAGAKRNR
ncbi:hypothetical protein [Oleiharenicola sp. Vm1]|uniref:hypothetical protein n=1 Tax=Oleiharenicola sp. Vm1 TaxID=3398393 RepID=UPI0039F5D4B0